MESNFLSMFLWQFFFTYFDKSCHPCYQKIKTINLTSNSEMLGYRMPQAVPNLLKNEHITAKSGSESQKSVITGGGEVDSTSSLLSPFSSTPFSVASPSSLDSDFSSFESLSFSSCDSPSSDSSLGLVSPFSSPVLCLHFQNISYFNITKSKV